jgi:formylglycine-generating enzyme required for sulfatase activity
VNIAEPFFLGATEVTFAQYNAFCEATDRDQPQNQDEGWGTGDRPVINVDWDDALAYAMWLDAMTGGGCRLPSEAEWEYAARADTTTEYALPAPDGSDYIADKGLANCYDCGSEWGGKQTAPVGSFEPNAWALYDMHGNVWEWVQDCWHQSYDDAPNDGQAWLEEDGGDCGRRVLRGGSWVNDQDSARSAYRVRSDPSGRSNDVGFRVLCSSPIFDH